MDSKAKEPQLELGQPVYQVRFGRWARLRRLMAGREGVRAEIEDPTSGKWEVELEELLDPNQYQLWAR